MNDYLDVLAHHGIKGQKWDIRNGPPYPLSKEDYSAAEKRFNRVGSKQQKLEKKSEKLHTKSAKTQLKSAKAKLKADKIKSRALGNQDKVYKYEHKAAVLAKKAAKMEVRSVRMDKKSQKLGKKFIEDKAKVDLIDTSLNVQADRLLPFLENNRKNQDAALDAYVKNPTTKNLAKLVVHNRPSDEVFRKFGYEDATDVAIDMMRLGDAYGYYRGFKPYNDKVGTRVKQTNKSIDEKVQRIHDLDTGAYSRLLEVHASEEDIAAIRYFDHNSKSVRSGEGFKLVQVEKELKEAKDYIAKTHDGDYYVKNGRK